MSALQRWPTVAVVVEVKLSVLDPPCLRIGIRLLAAGRGEGAPAAILRQVAIGRGDEGVAVGGAGEAVAGALWVAVNSARPASGLPAVK
jgi:hypothetical protein